MTLWLVEARRTLEWGGYYEADTEEEARQLALDEMQFDMASVVEEQMICIPKDPES